jgi:hypothetical protein
VGSRSPLFCTSESWLLLKAKARFHNTCLGHVMEGLNVRRRICGSILQQAWCSGNSPGVLFMGRTPNWAACEDFAHPYNGFSPVLCLLSQLETGWGDQPGPTKMGKQRMPGSCERGIVTVRRFFLRPMQGRKRSPRA